MKFIWGTGGHTPSKVPICRPNFFKHLSDCIYAIGWEVFLDKIFRNSSLEHQNTYPFNVYEDLHIHIRTKIHM